MQLWINNDTHLLTAPVLSNHRKTIWHRSVVGHLFSLQFESTIGSHDVQFSINARIIYL